MTSDTSPTKTFIDAIGGYRAVAARLGEKPRTVHNWTTWTKFPLAQYHNLHALASENGVDPPDDSLFPFKELPDPNDVVGAVE